MELGVGLGAIISTESKKFGENYPYSTFSHSWYFSSYEIPNR